MGFLLNFITTTVGPFQHVGRANLFGVLRELFLEDFLVLNLGMSVS